MFDYWNVNTLCSQSISADASSSTFMTCLLHYLTLLQVLQTFSVIMLLFLQITDSFIEWHWGWKASQKDFSLKKINMYLHGNVLQCKLENIICLLFACFYHFLSDGSY